MNHLGTITLAAMALPFLGITLPSGDALGQEKSHKEQLVGSWEYVSIDTIRPDGTRVPSYGPNPRGLATFGSDGRYVLLIARADLPKFASGKRIEGTPEEYKAVVQGSNAHFGRYTVDEAGKTLTFHIDTSTFPNWNGIEQNRPFTLAGDEMRWSNPASSGTGSPSEVVLRRAKTP
ncbi:lipocalin-like domain-containing protein [Azospirillum canadense]|uniref:lipocalin-like domain-containing protein n=1 Tax=Azospirillum canadense TaxID=403962 RepID=UPI002226FC90|nr:lipocalin-like domain-containing protein [Azospirillum canadense]MCW2242561.1 hypothetical protein [Azospirillum canadense]